MIHKPINGAATGDDAEMTLQNIDLNSNQTSTTTATASTVSTATFVYEVPALQEYILSWGKKRPTRFQPIQLCGGHIKVPALSQRAGPITFKPLIDFEH